MPHDATPDKSPRADDALRFPPESIDSLYGPRLEPEVIRFIQRNRAAPPLSVKPLSECRALSRGDDDLDGIGGIGGGAAAMPEAEPSPMEVVPARRQRERIDEPTPRHESLGSTPERARQREILD